MLVHAFSHMILFLLLRPHTVKKKVHYKTIHKGTDYKLFYVEVNFHL